MCVCVRLVIDTSVYSMYALYECISHNPLEIIITLSLLQMPSVICPFVSTILHYVECIACNQKFFVQGCNRAMGFLVIEKKQKG